MHDDQTAFFVSHPPVVDISGWMVAGAELTGRFGEKDISL